MLAYDQLFNHRETTGDSLATGIQGCLNTSFSSPLLSMLRNTKSVPFTIDSSASRSKGRGSDSVTTVTWEIHRVLCQRRENLVRVGGLWELIMTFSFCLELKNHATTTFICAMEVFLRLNVVTYVETY